MKKITKLVRKNTLKMDINKKKKKEINYNILTLDDFEPAYTSYWDMIGDDFT